MRLYPLSATASPNISSDEHNLSDGSEVCNEHLYSLGRFLSTSKQPGGGGGGGAGSSDLGSTATSTATLYNSQSIPNHSSPENGRHRVLSSSSNVAMPKKRRVTHSTATSNLLMESYEHGSLASAEDTPPPSGHSSPMPPAPLAAATQGCEGSGRHKPLSPQRSNTFSAPKSSLHQQVVSYTDTVLTMRINFYFIEGRNFCKLVSSACCCIQVKVFSVKIWAGGKYYHSR